VHILHGGPAAWSNALPVKVLRTRHWVAALAHAVDHPVVTAEQSSPPRVVKLAGAAADGFTDDSNVIQRAVDKLADFGGGVLVLAAGNYAVSSTIHVRPNVVLRGAGRAATQLVVAPGNPFRAGFPFPIEKLFAHPLSPGSARAWGPRFVSEGIMLWLDDRSGIADVSLLAGAGCSLPVIVGTEDPQKVARDVFLDRVEVLSPHQSTYLAPETLGTGTGGIRVFSATRGFTLTHCQITSGNPLFMDSSRRPHRYARIEGNVFRGRPNNAYDSVHLRRLLDSIFEDNEIFNARRAFVSQKGMSRNWICGNLVHHISGYTNGSEIFMSEHFGTLYRGRVKQVSANTLTFTTDLDFGPGEVEQSGMLLYCYVLSGRGAGQYREVLNNGRDSIEVDEPWTVKPDETSTVALIKSAVANYVVSNRVSDTRGDVQLLYLSGFDNVIAGNELHNAANINIGATVYQDKALPYGGDFAPVAYNLILDNRLVNSNGISMYTDRPAGSAFGDELMHEHGPLFANTVRRNQIWSPATPPGANQGSNLWWPRASGERSFSNPAVQFRNGAYNIVESCYLYNNSLGVQVTGGKGNVVRNNLMDLVSKPIADVDSAGTYFEPVIAPEQER
jgi:parallel beta-helix repeat protein